MKLIRTTRIAVGLAAIFCSTNLVSYAQEGDEPISLEAVLTATVNRAMSDAGASDPISYGQVVVVADEASNSLIVSAPEEVLRAIDELIRQLDQPVADQTVLKTFFLENADPAEMVATLTAMFPDPTASSTGGSSSAGFGPAPVFQSNSQSRSGNQDRRADGSESGRAMKLTQLVAVADTRTGAVIVNAPARMIPAVEGLIREIDANAVPTSSVAVIRLKHAATYELESILQGLVGGTSTQSSLDQSNPLLNRSVFLSGGRSGATLGGGAIQQSAGAISQ